MYMGLHWRSMEHAHVMSASSAALEAFTTQICSVILSFVRLPSPVDTSLGVIRIEVHVDVVQLLLDAKPLLPCVAIIFGAVISMWMPPELGQGPVEVSQRGLPPCQQRRRLSCGPSLRIG